MPECVFSRAYTDRIVQVWSEPERCRCGEMRVLFINRFGITYCCSCDPGGATWASRNPQTLVR